MKIGVKLILAFLLNVLLMGIVCNILISQLHQVVAPMVVELAESVEKTNASLRFDKHDSIFKDLRYYTEVQTQFARNYAFTQDPKWKQRYRDGRQDLARTLKDISKEEWYLSTIGGANEEALRIERQAIRLVDKGRHIEAQNLLESKAYLGSKDAIVASLEKWHHNIEEENKKVVSSSIENQKLLLIRIIRHFQNNEWLTIAFGFVSLALGLATGLLIALSISTPLRKLQKSMDEVGQGHLETKIDTSYAGEIGDLARSFSRMTEDLKTTTTSVDRLNREIADRKKVEKELSGQNKFLENILESLAHPFYVVDASNYKVIMANSAASSGKREKNVTCYALATKRGASCTGGETCSLGEVKRTRKPVVTEHAYYDADGNEKILEVHGYPIFDEEGNVAQMIEYSLDITERKKSEEETMNLQAQLLQAQKMESIGTMANGIAHSFNNMLGVIRGYTEMALCDVPESTQANDDLKQVVKNTMRAKELADKMLIFSRKDKPKLKPIEIQEVIKQAVDLFNASTTPSMEIHQNMDENSTIVMADSGQIQHVLLNLWTNSYHALSDSDGSIAVGLEEVEVDADLAAEYPNLEPGPHAHITVSDSGQGMDTETLARVFEPFFTTKEVGKGTGLGLSIVHGIVMNHKGDISVTSELGKGTRFDIYIPVVKENPVAV